MEIKSIAREAGSRTKIAVKSNDPNVDPVGACVGLNGARVNSIVSELKGEKIDIINWDENPAYLIENALSPAKVICVVADEDAREAQVIVPDYQLSLAIGKEGQNARLAAKLTGYKIDIKSETQARELGLFEEMGLDGGMEEGPYEGYPEEYPGDYQDGYGQDYAGEAQDGYGDVYQEELQGGYGYAYQEGAQDGYGDDYQEGAGDGYADNYQGEAQEESIDDYQQDVQEDYQDNE